MNNNWTDWKDTVDTAISGPHGALALALMSVVAIFGMYMASLSGESDNSSTGGEV